MKLPPEGRHRVVIECVAPEIEGGRFAIKRTAGETVRVEAVVFADGHDAVACELLYRAAGDGDWRRLRMAETGNDYWAAEFTVTAVGSYFYTVRAWMDPFRTWRTDLQKRLAAGQDVRIELLAGAQLIEQASRRAAGDDAGRLRDWAESLPRGNTGEAESEELLAAMERYPDVSLAVIHERELKVVVDREKARFSTWYEIFPRSTSPVAGTHGTFADLEKRLPYIASMGFDVLYLPPIHPIGRQFRKGKNNSTAASPDDVGSPWAIGDEDGGHTAIHPQLGTLEQFRSLLDAARGAGLETALDIAFQCTPDHPWTRAHPDWFRRRPDGTIQYAENPPKKYQDIYPLDFETADWRELWKALKAVFDFWIAQGVRLFRADNPHTKAFDFWEWCIAAIKEEHPDVLFLAEAFTRPHVMYRLAKLGFSQSYTYFTWRNSQQELRDYFSELTRGPAREYYRPNLWPNTPDILPQVLQMGGRPAFAMRLLLAATLGASYGIYGPAFELGENKPREEDSEEYLNSEKYELKHWDIESPQSLRHFIARVNRIRRDNPALQQDATLAFHDTDNPYLLCYSKSSADGANAIVVTVNLDWAHAQSGWVAIDYGALGLDPEKTFETEDLLNGVRSLWQGPREFLELDPGRAPGQILRIRRRVKTEKDFDYYL